MPPDCVVCPGLIDLAARLREPGFEYKATLESEMEAAVAGGVTSLACPPDTDPSLDEPGLVEMLKHRARSLNHAHVYPVGALTVGLKGEHITEMGELTEAGCIAFSHADAPLADTQVLCRAMQYAATFGYRVWLRPQDAYLAARRRRARRRGRDPARPRRRFRPARRSSRWTRSSHWRGRPARACISRGCRRTRAWRACARRSEPASGDLRCRRSPRAPVRRRHRLVRCAMPSGAAAAQRPRPRRPARRARRRHDRRYLLRPRAGRRRQQAAAVRRGRAGRDRRRAAAAVDAQMGARSEDSAGCGARPHHRRAGADPRDRRRPSRTGRCRRCLHRRRSTSRGRSRARR